MDTPTKISELMEGAQNCAIEWANVKRGEKVLIVTDTACDMLNTEAIASVCRGVGADVTTIIMQPQGLPNQEPPAPVAAAMKAADMIFAPLKYTISHTDSRFDANAAGARYIGMYSSLTTDALASEGAKFPAEIIYMVTRKVAEQWRRGKQIRITCAKGTDIKADITDPDNNVVGWHATADKMGTYDGGDSIWANKFGNFAGGFGVVGMWPAWTAEGVIYFDAAHTFTERLRTPLKYTVEQGRVVKFEGDPEQVLFFENIVETFGPDAAHLAEFMIGLNPKTRIFLADGTHMEAHRHAGALHTAIGMSVDNHRTVNPGVHLDNLIIEPTIYIDDEVCVDAGKLRVYYDDPDVLGLLEKYEIGVE
ncbi:MAG: M29 family metallopeptidase [Thermoleophilia bacterium]